MKILYITPTIHDAGGVERVLAVKTNYLIEQYGYSICFLTLNNTVKDPFFKFNPAVSAVDLKINETSFCKVLRYYKQVKSHIKTIQPDVVVVCSSGWKSFLFHFFVKIKQPIVLEIHNSIQYSGFSRQGSLSKTIRKSMIKWALKTVKNKVFLSELSKMEYGNEGVVISNPITITSNEIANLQSKRVICVARHSHEKGIDRLLHIWKEINAIHPEWILDIYGDGILYDTNVALANQLNIASSINFYLPITNIDEKYLEASLCLMTSRYEGLPLVLIEALHFGLPIVVYDCPDGPRVIIENETNGFLVPNGNQRDFIRQTIKLMDDFELRTTIGKAAKLSAKKYDREAIMEKWDTYFKTLV